MQAWQLKQMQSLPLAVKIEKSKQRIKEWYEHFSGNVYVSFSGGKDSTVLLHLVRSMYKDVEAVFCDTGLEYPELKEFVKSVENVTVIRPKLNFREVISKYGYPVISKEVSEKIYRLRHYNVSDKVRQKYLYGDEQGRMNMIPLKWQKLINSNFEVSDHCCRVMKKAPFKSYERISGNKPIIGTMASESIRRTQTYLHAGCNSFEAKKQKSAPLSFWTENDIFKYIRNNSLKIASVYGAIYKEKVSDTFNYKTTGCSRTGCIFCCFGMHLENYPNRYQKLELSHPELHDYCVNKLGFKDILDFLEIPYCRPAVSKEKYKKETVKISCRVDKEKLEIVKNISGVIKNTEIIDILINEVYKNADKRKKSKQKQKGDPDATKYKKETVKISCRVDIKKLDVLRNHLGIDSNSALIDCLIDKKCRTLF
jgi:3'-phosphoadenosine 5'-phosphosulfate sulfotransferase (PAPS reductase)/FAD synthetase